MMMSLGPNATQHLPVCPEGPSKKKKAKIDEVSIEKSDYELLRDQNNQRNNSVNQFLMFL
jgi:hypothetical protein